jgi:hypothetical protein
VYFYTASNSNIQIHTPKSYRNRIMKEEKERKFAKGALNNFLGVLRSTLYMMFGRPRIKWIRWNMRAFFANQKEKYWPVTTKKRQFCLMRKTESNNVCFKFPAKQKWSPQFSTSSEWVRDRMCVSIAYIFKFPNELSKKRLEGIFIFMSFYFPQFVCACVYLSLCTTRRMNEWQGNKWCKMKGRNKTTSAYQTLHKMLFN